MRVLVKSTIVTSFIFSCFTLQAQSLDSLVVPVSAAVSENISVAVKSTSETEGTKVKRAKAERQIIGKLKNVYKIDEGIYRSEQPGVNDFIALEEMGLVEVLNLRRFRNDNKKAGKTDLKLHHISMKAGDIEEKEVIKALRIINERKGPILIHCWHGSDRTGMLMAMYRIIFQNWSKDEAIHEMTNGNFGFHSIYGNIIDFVRDADIAKIKKEAGIKGAEEQPKDAEEHKDIIAFASEHK